MMKISENGISLIKSFEGLRLKAYKAVSTEEYYTIGYGHYGADVAADMVITACPLCLYNLSKNAESDIPVKYFTEILAEALGVK